MYFVKPSKAFIVVPYQEGKEIGVYDAISTEITMGNVDDEKCPLD